MTAKKSKKSEILLELETKEASSPLLFTGVARTIQCFNHINEFRNFRVMTLHLEKGVVTKIDYSDPYASFEAGSRLDLANDYSLLKLNAQWFEGSVLQANRNVPWENDEKTL